MSKHGVPAEIYEDHRYSDIGDLPTGFGPYREHGVSKLYIRPFCVRELSLLNSGASMKQGGLARIVRAVDMTLSCDANILTDGDFEFVLTWLRMSSYPKAPSLVTWVCTKVNVVHKDGKAFYDGDASRMTGRELDLKGLEQETCNTENNEIVHQSSTTIHTFDDDLLTMKYEDLDFPRVATLIEFDDLMYDRPDLRTHASYARWMRKGSTLQEKIESLNSSGSGIIKRIRECIRLYHHGVSERMGLRCRSCGNRVQHSARPDPRTFFADNTEKNIMDIQYTLLSEFGLQPNDDMPAMTLLYHHSCYAKDKQAEAERENIRKSMRR